MARKEDKLATKDGLKLHYQFQLPEDDPRAVVLILHSLCEHSGRYLRLAQAVAKANYLAALLDFRGHGKSEGDRASFWCFDDLVDDVDRLLTRLQLYYPMRPVFVLGQGLGATVALHLVVKRRPNMDGAILAAPIIRIPSHVFPWLHRLGGMLGRWFPRAKVLEWNYRHLSSDPAVIEEFKIDPFVYHDKLTVRTGREIFDAAAQILNGAEAVHAPLLILHGSGDRIADPTGSQVLHARAHSTKKTLHLYPGMCHDVFHEPEHALVTKTVIEWLDTRCEEKLHGTWNPDI